MIRSLSLRCYTSPAEKDSAFLTDVALGIAVKTVQGFILPFDPIQRMDLCHSNAGKQGHALSRSQQPLGPYRLVELAPHARPAANGGQATGQEMS